MFATAVTLAVMGFVFTALADLARHDGAKIVAALSGRSWAAEPKPARQLIVRFSSAYKAAEPAPVRPALRAAA